MFGKMRCFGAWDERNGGGRGQGRGGAWRGQSGGNDDSAFGGRGQGRGSAWRGQSGGNGGGAFCERGQGRGGAWDERPARGRNHRAGSRGSGRGRLFENGMLRLILLALVVETPRHGYELIKDIEERTGGAYCPSAGVIYPTLTLLEETGQISVLDTEGSKKLYAITDAGRATVAENRAAIDAVFARFAELGAEHRADRDPRLVRAVENLRMALRLKTADSEIGTDRITALAALLDETARKIELI